MSIYQLIYIHIGIIAFYNLGGGLQCVKYLLDTSQLFGLNLGSLIQQYDITEFYLLNNKILYILFVNMLTCKFVATSEFALKTKRIDHGYYAIKTAHSVLNISTTHLRNRTNGLSYRFRFADAARLNNDVIETLHLHKVEYLFYEVHLQCAADTSVLQCHKAIIFLAYNTTLLNEVGINVNLAYIVYYNRELYSFLVSENMVYQSSLSTAQITGQEQYRNVFFLHFLLFLYCVGKNTVLFCCLCSLRHAYFAKLAPTA